MRCPLWGKLRNPLSLLVANLWIMKMAEDAIVRALHALINILQVYGRLGGEAYYVFHKKKPHLSRSRVWYRSSSPFSLLGLNYNTRQGPWTKGT